MFFDEEEGTSRWRVFLLSVIATSIENFLCQKLLTGIRKINVINQVGVFFPRREDDENKREILITFSYTEIFS